MPAKTLPYLQWQPGLDPRQIYSQEPSPQYPAYYKQQFYCLEQRAAEGGRNVLVRRLSAGSGEALTADGFNIRSRVHEYGGRAFLLADDYVWFSNDDDRRIYRQRLTAQAVPEALTTADSQCMAIDFQLTADGSYLLFIQEKIIDGGENENLLAFLSLHAGLPASPCTLVTGADFYSNPVISPDGRQLSWIEWNHPRMPWDGSLLKSGNLIDDGSSLSVEPASIKTVAGGLRCAVSQLQYSPGGRLFFALDGHDDDRSLQADCWDLFAWDGNAIVRITRDNGEYGEAHWIFGQQRYQLLDEEKIVAVRTENGSDQLVSIDIQEQSVHTIDGEGSTGLSQLSLVGQGEVIYRAASFTQAAAVHVYSAETGKVQAHCQPSSLLADDAISVPDHLTFPTTDGGHSFAWYYAPKNPKFQAPAAGKPPLLVMVHGGPTSRCDSELNYQRQYWTSRGFAVLDVNHRGSTGYCRQYRQALLGQWGLMDSQDVADAVTYVIRQGLAHPRQICIRGGSAGGYVVLRALTLFPDLFCAGACYYGIGNLVTLMEFTHKFEAHYLDGLLAAPYLGAESDQPGSPYYDRSPLHDLDHLKSPMIVFQGLEDKVVPPELSRELVNSLQSRGIYHQYVEYAGEGHGFRKLETRVDALQKETDFFYEVINQNQH